MALDSPEPVSANLAAEIMTMTYPFPVSADEFKGKQRLHARRCRVVRRLLSSYRPISVRLQACKM
jgi:hypothetical protein